jgi:ribose/xylose/arabinose/galactoside ABC-type transport system permease subunit
VVLLLGAVITAAAPTITLRGAPANAFLRWDNLLASVATPMSWMAIMALGATFVIVSGGIDISVGSVFGLSALGAAAALQELPRDAGLLQCLLVGGGAALGIGLACGLLNGALVVGLRIHPFIVTLGTLSIFRGLGLVLVESKTLPSLGHVLPDAITSAGIGARWTWGAEGARTFVQPVPLLVMLVCVAAAWVFLAHTVPGREVYAVGGNEEAARFAGLPVARVKLRVFALSGLCAGVAGLLSCGFYQSANTATGEGYELTVIAAAVVGGASLLGGRGTALGALLGALVIKLIENGIDILKELPLGFATLPLGKEYGKIVIGVAILLAVAVDRLAERWRGARGAAP